MTLLNEKKEKKLISGKWNDLKCLNSRLLCAEPKIIVNVFFFESHTCYKESVWCWTLGNIKVEVIMRFASRILFIYDEVLCAYED